jgi:hypothetical protein
VTEIAKLASVTLVMLFLAGMAFTQTDPGVQSGSRGTGAALSSVLANSPSGILAFFTDGQNRFQELETVSNSANVGLGPRFNSNSCSSLRMFTTCLFSNKPGGQASRPDFYEEIFLCPRFRHSPEGTQRTPFL